MKTVEASTGDTHGAAVHREIDQPPDPAIFAARERRLDEPVHIPGRPGAGEPAEHAGHAGAGVRLRQSAFVAACKATVRAASPDSARVQRAQGVAEAG